MVEAVDWAIFPEQIDTKSDWHVVRGLLVGFLIQDTVDYLVLAPQLFPDEGGAGEVRCTIVVPRQCIKKMTVQPMLLEAAN